MSETEMVIDCQFCIWHAEEQTAKHLYAGKPNPSVNRLTDGTPVCRHHALAVLLSGKVLRDMNGENGFRV